LLTEEEEDGDEYVTNDLEAMHENNEISFTFSREEELKYICPQI